MSEELKKRQNDKGNLALDPDPTHDYVKKLLKFSVPLQK